MCIFVVFSLFCAQHAPGSGHSNLHGRQRQDDLAQAGCRASGAHRQRGAAAAAVHEQPQQQHQQHGTTHYSSCEN